MAPYILIGQNTNKYIEGLIRDESNNPVPNAGLVRLYSPSNSLLDEVEVDGSGLYRFDNVNPGRVHLYPRCKYNRSIHPNEVGAQEVLPNLRRFVDITTGPVVNEHIQTKAAPWSDNFNYPDNITFRKTFDGAGAGGWGSGFTPTNAYTKRTIATLDATGKITVSGTHPYLKDMEVIIVGTDNPTVNAIGRARITSIPNNASVGSGPAPSSNFTCTLTGYTASGGTVYPCVHELVPGGAEDGQANACRTTWPEREGLPNIANSGDSNGFQVALFLTGPMGSNANWWTRRRLKCEPANVGRGTQNWSANNTAGNAPTPEQKMMLHSFMGASGTNMLMHMWQDHTVGTHRLGPTACDDGAGHDWETGRGLSRDPPTPGNLVETFDWRTWVFGVKGYNTTAPTWKILVDGVEVFSWTIALNNWGAVFSNPGLISFWHNRNCGNARISAIESEQGMYHAMPDPFDSLAGT